MQIFSLRLIIIFALLIQSISAYSQHLDSAWIKIVTKTEDASIYLDGKEYKSGTLLRIDTGVHQIKGIALGTKEVKKEVRCLSNKVKLVRLELPLTEEYSNHLKLLKKYNRKRSMLKFGPAAIYIIYAAITYNEIAVLDKKTDDNLTSANRFKRLYNTSYWLNDINENRNSYEFYKDKYDRDVDKINQHNQNLIIGLGGTVALTAVGWYITSKMDKPIFKETSAFNQFKINPIFFSEVQGLQIKYTFK